MPCSACATNALRCFSASFESANSAVSRTFNTRLLHAVSNQRRLNTASHTRGSRELTLSPPFRRRNDSGGRAPPPADLHKVLGNKEEGFIRFADAFDRGEAPGPIGGPMLRRSVQHDTSIDGQWWKKSISDPDSKVKRDPGAAPIDDSKPFHASYRNRDLSNPTNIGRKLSMRDSPRSRHFEKTTSLATHNRTKAALDASDDAPHGRSEREPWQVQKSALSAKFGSSGWSPRKRLSPDSLEGIRALHAQYPNKFTTPVLADQFKVSPEAIRRILKSKWRPNDEEEERRRERWNQRGVNIWSQMNELGIKPPKKWRVQGVGKYDEHAPPRDQRFEASKRIRDRASSDPELLSQGRPTTPAVRQEKEYQVPLANRIL